MKAGSELVLRIIVLCAVSTALSLTVNAIRADNALTLGRDYFAKVAVAPEPAKASDADAAPPTKRGSPAGTLTDHTGDASSAGDDVNGNELGVRVVLFDEVCHFFEDPDMRTSLCLFIDARDDDHYNDGHIPGALQVDNYRREKFLPDVLPRVEQAKRVVVYCHGGGCEDSLFVCQALMDHGVDPDKLYLFKGGWEEWVESGMPVEKKEAD